MAEPDLVLYGTKLSGHAHRVEALLTQRAGDVLDVGGAGAQLALDVAPQHDGEVDDRAGIQRRAGGGVRRRVTMAAGEQGAVRNVRFGHVSIHAPGSDSFQPRGTI